MFTIEPNWFFDHISILYYYNYTAYFNFESELFSLFQDVSEFSHKLLDWLEDAFQLAANE